jgi:hypothetical protein
MCDMLKIQQLMKTFFSTNIYKEQQQKKSAKLLMISRKKKAVCMDTAWVLEGEQMTAGLN